MTVCIAARCSAVDKVVLVSDSMISSDWTSTEGVLKLESLDRDEHWFAMFAGHPPRFAPLLELIREQAGVADGELRAILEGCQRAAAVRVEQIVNIEVLSPYGITRDEFIRNGREWFGEIRFGALLETIAATDLGVSLLVGGFDEAGKPHVFEMTSKGVLLRQDDLGFHAIGSGSYAALATLYPDPTFCAEDNLSNIIYRVCAAKFAAETTPGVGRDTVVLVIDKDRDHLALADDAVTKLRALWKSKGQPVIPDGAAKIIQSNIQQLFPKDSP